MLEIFQDAESQRAFARHSLPLRDIQTDTSGSSSISSKASRGLSSLFRAAASTFKELRLAEPRLARFAVARLGCFGP